MSGAGFLAKPVELSAQARQFLDEDGADVGYVMSTSWLWARDPLAYGAIFALMRSACATAELTYRQRCILVAACASAFGDSYCSLAWGSKLTEVADADIAAGVLRGDDRRLSAEERALARWARKVAKDQNSTDSSDVEQLRAVGYDDSQILAITTFVAMRIAFSTSNDALGACPDAQFSSTAPAEVLQAVTYGRLIAAEPSQPHR